MVRTAHQTRHLMTMAVAVGLCLVTVWVAAFIWVWIGQLTVSPSRYESAADWWGRFVLPRAGWSLVVGVPLGCLVAFGVARFVDRRREPPTPSWPLPPVSLMTTNYGDRSTPQNIAGTHLVRCIHMLMLQHARLLLPRQPMDWETTFGKDLDATFYAYTLRHSVQVAEMCRVFNPGKIGSAIKDFETAVPNYKRVRDVLEHFDAYETGSGNLADVGAALADSVHFFEYDAATQIMRIGDMSIDVTDSFQAANALLSSVRAVLTPDAFPPLPKGN